MTRKLLLSIAFVLAVQLLLPSKASAQCGGAGDVPCYDWSWCAYTTPSIFGDVCWGGLVASTPFGGCNSDRLNNWGLVCVACGAPFQPTCNLGPTCDTDQRYTPVGFCYPCGASGNAACTSGPACDVGNREVFGFCSPSGFSDEPTTNVETMPTLTQSASLPVRGIADLHAHQFSNLGFGGVVFWGAPFDFRGINAALAWCDYTLDFSTEWASSGVVGPVTPLGYEIHGPKAFQALTHPISNGLPEGQHDVEGTGAFSGWPSWETYTHQMMYYKWLERAYLGGVRLIVVQTVSNEALCLSGKRRADFTCDDMDAVDKEIQAAKQLQVAIDFLDDFQLNNSGWYQIAYSPAQARQIIRDGKLAVVLGIEVDSLFDCKPNSTCSQAYLHDQLQYYYSQGIRHIFPIHQFDNAFGGAALFRNELNAGNIVVGGSHFTVRDCSADGYTFNLDSTVTDFLNLLVNGNPLPPQATYNLSAADCNARGLTDTGRTLINELIKQHFIIDTDHMSRLMIDSVLPIAQTLSGSRLRKYPLVSSHSNFMSKEATKDEFSLTDAQLAIFKDIGGMVTVGNPKGGCDLGYKDQLTFAVNAMKKGPDDQFPGVAFSTDVNGFAGNTAPRVGNAGCTDTSGAGPMPYPFTGVMGGTFDRQVTGQRTFDFNTDGEAHYGLIADFFADLKYAGGLTNSDIDPLLNSAETYIRLWENVNDSDQPPPPPAPTVTSHITGTMGQNGYYTSDVTVSWDVQSDPAGGTPKLIACDPTTITSDTRGAGMVIACVASNSSGKTTAYATIKRDTTPPFVQIRTNVSGPAGTWTNQDVVVDFLVSDVGSGIVGPQDVKVTVNSEGANQTVQMTFSDQAGNTITVQKTGINIDKTPPRIGFRFANLPQNATPDQIVAEQAKWHNLPVTLVLDPQDSLSGVQSVSDTQWTFAADGSNVRQFTATDNAGNTITVTNDPIKIDMTPPTITFLSRLPAANGAGWNNTPVDVTWKCSDSLSGVAAPTITRHLASEGSPQSATQTCVDNAGNTASNTIGNIRIDLTPPTLTFGAQQPLANGNGWNNTDVRLPFTAADPLSGLASTSIQSPLTLSGEGAAITGTVTVTDVAGNHTTITSPSVRIDRTPPVISQLSRLPAANAAGWNNSDVTATWSCSDTVSGVVSPQVSKTLSSEGANQTATATCADLAGNSAADTRGGFNLDKTPPTIVPLTRLPAPNAAGWNNTAVDLTWQCGDSLSGVIAQTVARHVASEGDAQSATQNCVDVAGNAASNTVGNIRIDVTPPALRFDSQQPLPNANGWNNTDVAVPFTATDALSGVASTSIASPLTLTTESAATSGAVTVTDVAGNAVTLTSPVVKIDKTPPTIVPLTRLPAPNAAGWNNTAVDLTWQCGDSLSGVTAQTVARHVASEGDAQSATQNCVDAAGNAASHTVGNIRIDVTPPALRFDSQQPLPNANGWNNTNVAVPFTATDALSGVASTSIASPLTLTMESAATSGAVTVTDVAGNAVTFTSPAVKIDKTPPAITAPAVVNVETRDRRDSIATFAASAADLLAGVDPVVCAPASGSTFLIGTTPVSCTAIDHAGNATHASVSVVVTQTRTEALQIDVPGDVTREAAGPAGATVDYTASAHVTRQGRTPRTDVPVSCSPASGSTFSLGTTVVTCTAASGGTTEEATFVVAIRDTRAPQLDLPDRNVVVEATGPGGAAVTFAATATDAVDGSDAVVCAPASGSTFALGVTTVNCKTTDHAGNTSNGRFAVAVRDTTPPVLTLPADIVAQPTGRSGSVITYSVSAADLVDGARPVWCSRPSGTRFPIGETTVTCWATDARGNTATGSFAVEVTRLPTGR